MAEKLYKETWAYGADVNQTGFAYKDNLLKKSMSPRFFSGNVIAEGFLGKINEMLFTSIESVKILRNFFNYTVEKDQSDVK